MTRPVLRFSLLPVLLLIAAPASAGSFPIQIDGYYSDWTGIPVAATDPAGDDGASGIDFTTLTLAHDENYLFIRFDTTVEVQGDEQQDISLAIDNDLNAGTGTATGGIGAELVWDLGQRNGTFLGGSIDHPDIGLVLSATVSDTQFEIALDRNATPNGPLFPGNSFHMALIDNASGDVLTFTGAGYSFDATPQPVPSIGLGRTDPTDIRVASYNIQGDGLFDGGSTEAAQDRIFDAIDPDVWVINEAWNSSAAQVAAQVEVLLPSGPGESWSAVKLDGGNVIVSRFPILNSWEINPGDRLTAALVDPGPSYATDLLIVGNHWSCCTADANRQRQADALIAFLRDARTPGGVIDLAQDTPIIACGDFNLVGWRDQLTTLITGNIDDNGTWGVDSPPDWDGSDFADVNPRHPDARFAYTWRNDFSSFYPGKLDWIVYTSSVLTLKNNYVVETRTMTPTSLSNAGLLSNDTITASDHAPLVADFEELSVSGVGDADVLVRPGVALLAAAPNPFHRTTSIRFHLTDPTPVTLEVFDASGRAVRRLIDRAPRATGDHVVSWDGRDAGGVETPSGRYFYRLVTPRGTLTGGLVRLR